MKVEMVITPADYWVDDTKRALSDAVCAAAKIRPGMVACLEKHDELWRIKVWKLRHGKRYLNRHREPAHRWVEVNVPTARQRT